MAMFSYSIAKIAGVFALIFFGFAVYGAILGYLFGPLVGLAQGWYFFKGSKVDDSDNFELKRIMNFAMPVIIFSVIFTFLMNELNKEDVKTFKGIVYNRTR
jgi:NhaP-type Na+/H+ or K+/H+ antiporter